MSDLLNNLNGATRLHFIVGDPIAQVKSPAGVTQSFAEKGMNDICIPAHVSSSDLSAWFAGISKTQNVDGIIITVPHKFASYEQCSTASDRGHFLKAVNTLRRNPDGTWHGDMFDGMGYVQALQKSGCELKGKRALLVGAGGAGSAIAYSLVTGGVSHLAVHDPDATRRDTLIKNLEGLGLCTVAVGSADPTGFDVAINASPVGMKTGDPLPIDASRLKADQFVGCVITAPAVPPLIQAARALGCSTMTGADMFAGVRDLMLAFLTEKV